MVGANLQYMRKYRKLSMSKVAEQIPFTFQQLQKYEKGRNTIGAYKLTKLCGIYKVNIADIVNETFIENHQNSLAYTEEIKPVHVEHINRQLNR